MDTIHNYLETMFSALPNTDAVYHAKDELSAMMEDKYQALLSEGLSEEEAVAKVIAEFGSLEEIAEDLGIKEALACAGEVQHALSEEEAQAYLKDKKKQTRRFAFGVCLIAASRAVPPAVLLAADYLYGNGHFPYETVRDCGTIGSILLIAFGVGLVLLSVLSKSGLSFLSGEGAALDYPALSATDRMYGKEQGRLSVKLALGVGLCVLALMPSFVYIESLSRGYWGLVFSTALPIICAFGGYLVLTALGRKLAFERLLNINGKDTVGGNQFMSQKLLHFDEPFLEDLMSVYWQSALCLYLSWSFLTFSWTKTWILWPVAALLYWLIRYLFGKESV